MFFLIGIGLKPKHLSLEALEAIKESDSVYLEEYTSFYSEGSIRELEEIIGKKIIQLGRKEVEEDFNKILESSKEKNVALLVFGNSLTATTHIQLIADSKKGRINAKFIPGISVVNIIGKSGLQEYKFGRIVSIVFWEELYKPTSFFDSILENRSIGLHTLCLLDIKKEKEKFMSINQAIGLIQKIDKDDVLNKDTFIGLAGLGSNKEEIFAGSINDVKNHSFKSHPQALIICGKLNETELEFIKELGLSGE